MPRCSGSKPDGSPCERIVGASQSFCYSHDPARSEERHRAASKAAKSKPNREIQDIKTRLSELAEEVLGGSVDRSDAAVVGQLLNCLIRAIGMELKVKEVEELEGRIEQIEAALERQQSNRWGRSV